MSKHERSMKDTVPLKGSAIRLTSNLTPLSRSSGKIPMNCDLCGTGFETYACWAKRKKNHYCSKGCADEGKRRIAERQCVECGKTMQMIPSHIERISTCSQECSRERRRKQMLKEAQNMAASAIYNYGNHERGSQISTKLDESMVRAIRADTRTQAAIAREYRIGQATVSFIKRGHTWGHVKD
jgi:hypothetical protein